MMTNQNTEKSLEYLRFDGEDQALWRGPAQEIADALGEANLQNVYNALKILDDLNCIHRITRGTAFTPSVYALLREPTEEDYKVYRERSIVLGRGRIPNAASRNRASIISLYRENTELTERVSVLEGLVGDLTTRLEGLESVIKNYAVRDSSG